MAGIFITGSADGLGQLTAKALINLGHQVVLHARNEERARQALKQAPGAEAVLIADLSSIKETKALAEKANAYGSFDVVIHNAGVYRVAPGSVGAEGWPLVFTVNSLAPYLLTALMHKPQRLIYLSSGMHRQGDPNIDHAFNTTTRRAITYSDTKLHNVILPMAISKRWPAVYSNAVNPGWVPTKMGGVGAPDSLEKGFETQVWLAVSNDPKAMVSGRYFHHKKEADFLQAANDKTVQERFLALCERVTGIAFP